MSRNLHPQQHDLFHKPVFETRETEPINLDRFRSKIKRAMSAAITECGFDRKDIAAKISSLPGVGTMSKTMLDAYTSEAKDHDISLVRFKALARVIQSAQLWDQAISDDGLIVLQGDEARLAEIALLQQKRNELSKKIRILKSIPVEVRRAK